MENIGLTIVLCTLILCATYLIALRIKSSKAFEVANKTIESLKELQHNLFWDNNDMDHLISYLIKIGDRIDELKFIVKDNTK